MAPLRKITPLIGLAILAFALRIGAVHLLSTPQGPSFSYEHGEIAKNLLAGKGFSVSFLGVEGPTSQQAPFYPFLLAAAYKCLGVDSPAAFLAIQWLQCLAGAGLVLAVFWLGRSLAPDRPAIAWAAALLATVYPAHLYMVTHLQVAPWAALALTLLVAVVLEPRWSGTWTAALLAGALSGALLLVEPILAVALPICAWAFWRRDMRRPGVERLWPAAARVAGMTGLALALIAPWLVRNYHVHGEFVFIKSSFGYAFWQGNNPLSWGTDKLPKASAEELRRSHNGALADMNRALWEARHETLYIDDVLLKPSGYREFRGLTEPERSRLLGEQAWQYVESAPGAYARLCLNRFRYFLLFDETNPKAANRLYRLSTVAWLLLSLWGVWLARDRLRELRPTYAVFAAVLAFHTLVIVSARFRIPVEPLSFVWAAFALVRLTIDFARRPPIRVYRPGERPVSPLGHALRGPHFGKAPSRSRAPRR